MAFCDNSSWEPKLNTRQPVSIGPRTLKARTGQLLHQFLEQCSDFGTQQTFDDERRSQDYHTTYADEVTTCRIVIIQP